MKLSFAAKITLLAQVIFLTAAILVALLLHNHIRSVINTSQNTFYEQQIGFVVNALRQKEEQLRSMPAPQRFPEAFRESVLNDLQQTYYRGMSLETYPFIVDQDGAILMHPSLVRGDRSLHDTFSAQIVGMKSGVTGMVEHGEERHIFFNRFPAWEWIICWSVPEKITFADFTTLQGGMITILVVSILFMGILFAYFMNRMLRPISTLTGMANAISEGDMQKNIDILPDDEVGSLARAFVHMQEVIKEKIALLHRSEQKYRELVQHANSIILRWDKEGRILYLNDFGLRLFGFPSEEIIGRHVVGTIVAETESTSGRDLPAMINDILLRPEAYVLNENENICKDGSRIWIQWSNNAILDEQGRFIEMLSVGIDISERKKAEKLLQENENRYRALFESAGDAILIRDENGVCIDCNRKALELFGCTRDQLVGLTPDFITPEFQPNGISSKVKAQELITKAIAGEPQTLEWQVKCSDGQIRDVKAMVSSFAANEKKYVQSILTDITRQKRMEVELRQAQKMEGIGTLAGGIAHDFNNILSAIIGYTELAQMKIDQDSELAKDLAQVRKASERAKGLVRQILTFSRKQKQEDTVLQINLIVKEALKLIRSSIPTTIEIVQNLSTRAAVRTDPTLIHQLIMNLCTNAYQAMLDTGGKLTVAMHEIDIDNHKTDLGTTLPEGSYVRIDISDTGCGMNREVMARIFDPFFTTKEQGRGTGLGLAVVHDIVQGLNGAITVESEPGKGTTFHVYLPLVKEHNESKDSSDGKAISHHGNARIMVVDDEAAIRDLMGAILSSSGYQVNMYNNGEDAWQAFSRNPDDWSLIITDQTMPKMTGAELAVQAMKLRPDIPVVICTGYSESITVEKAHEIGIRTYLHKPLSLNELLAAVHEALDS